MPYAELGAVRLYYERAGSGECELLFVHGWCCDRTAFSPQFDHFARTHAVTALDPRGCGRSDQPEDGYTIPDFADDLAQFCAVVGIDRPVVIGHSLGGMIGVELAARHPSLPRALVLVDPGPIDPLPETVKLFDSFAEQLEGPSGEDVRRLYAQDMGARDEDLARWIVDLMCAAPLPTAFAVNPRRRCLERCRCARALRRAHAAAFVRRSVRTPMQFACSQSSLTCRSGSRPGPALPPARGTRPGQRHDRALPRDRGLIRDRRRVCRVVPFARL